MAAATTPTISLTTMVSATTFNNLSILAVVFCSLSALFGVYFVLAVFAIFSAYRKDGSPYRALRIVTIVLFCTLLAHYISRGVIFGQARIQNPPALNTEQRIATVPLAFMTATTGTLAGFLSDSLVVWRFYVVYGKQRWALYIPAVFIVVNSLLGLSGDLHLLAYYRDAEPQTFASVQLVEFRINAAWGWFTFCIHTALTGAIIGKIVYISRKARANNAITPYGTRYNTVLAAITESALVTWIALLLYEIASLAPTGHITNVRNIGFVMICITPVFFGISQCLITVHLGLAKDRLEDKSTSLCQVADSNSSETNKVTIAVCRETVTCYNNPFVLEKGGPHYESESSSLSERSAV